MEITEIKTVTQKVIVGYRCDRCGKEDKEAEHWATMQHGHHEWGNDSRDSIERFNLCSPACYLEQLKESADGLANYSSAEIDDKPIAFVVAMLAYLRSPDGPGYEEGAGMMRLNYEP